MAYGNVGPVQNVWNTVHVYHMWNYVELMFVQLCTILPICMASWCYILFCESNFLLANKLISSSPMLISLLFWWSCLWHLNLRRWYNCLDFYRVELHRLVQNAFLLSTNATRSVLSPGCHGLSLQRIDQLQWPRYWSISLSPRSRNSHVIRVKCSRYPPVKLSFSIMSRNIGCIAIDS